MSTNSFSLINPNNSKTNSRVRFPVRFKITLPYLLLSVILALSGSYIVFQMFFDTLENRFENQLIESGKLASDRMVLEERERLEILRLIMNLDGLAEGIDTENSEDLRQLILPVVINSNEQQVIILDKIGESVLSLNRIEESKSESISYSFSKGEVIYQDWSIVQHVLNKELDAGRDKFADVVVAPWGNYFYVAGPVHDNNENLVGVVLVGISLDQLVIDFRRDTLAHITIYNYSGQIMNTSFLLFDETSISLSSDETQFIKNNQDHATMQRDITVGSLDYGDIIGIWEARDGQDLGIIGASQPKNFLVNTSTTTRVQIISFILIGFLLVISVGVYISQVITRPLIKVVEASTQVASGDLGVKVEPTGHDEITVLANAFNSMVDGLQEATERRVREIELLSKLEQEREINELKSRFVSMVSHEFRTPLTTILSSSQFIRKYGHSVQQQKQDKHFDRIENTVQHMTKMLEEVLFIGQSDANHVDFKPEYFDFISFCEEIVEQVQMSNESHDVRFSQIGDCKWVNADKTLLKNILYNLLSNAIKYSPNSDYIKFNLICELDDFLIQIIDSGIGIPDSDFKKLFEPFHRAKNVNNISGTGLGLYVTKIAVELHNGEILVNSEVGVGTTFTIRIPVSD